MGYFIPPHYWGTLVIPQELLANPQSTSADTITAACVSGSTCCCWQEHGCHVAWQEHRLPALVRSLTPYMRCDVHWIDSFKQEGLGWKGKEAECWEAGRQASANLGMCPPQAHSLNPQSSGCVLNRGIGSGPKRGHSWWWEGWLSSWVMRKYLQARLTSPCVNSTG